jgi:hypothetical protein
MLFWLALAAALAFATARIALGHPPPRGRYRVLSRPEAAFAAAVAEAMYPPGGAIEASGGDADLPGYFDRLLAASHPRQRLLMRLLFFLVEHATLFFPAPGRGGRRRFSSLDTEQQVAALDGWAESRLFARRLVFTSLRALCTLGYFAHPPVLRQLSLAPWAIDPPVCEADLLYPPIGAAPAAIRRRALTPPSDGTPLDPDGPLHPAFAGDDA